MAIEEPFSGEERTRMKVERNDAMVNGALIGLGALGILDNIVSHWLLGLHRAVPGAHAMTVEMILVVLSAGMLLLGLLREARARRL